MSTTTAIASTDITGTTTPFLLQESIASESTTTTSAASPGSTTPSTDLGAMLSAAIAGGYLAHASGGTYTVSAPIVIHIDSTIQGPMGIDLGGATIVSQIANGAPVIEFIVGPGVDLRYLTLSNFTIQGNGQEGDGIKIVADGNDRWVYNWNIDRVTVNHVGGYGLDVQGSVFEGLVSDSSMNDNGAGGAYFSHSANGGIVSSVHWFGGGFEGNGGDGLTLDNGARDMSVDGVTFANNHGVGISAGSGITSVTDSTFDDNQGAGVWFQNYGNFNNDTFTTAGSQTTGIDGYLGSATLIGNSSAYTGTGTDPTVLANLQGNGQIFASGNSSALVTGANVAISEPGDGSLAHVVTSDQGVALPSLAPITAATTAPVDSSDGTGALETALTAAMAGGYVAHLTDVTYTVTAPIVINVTNPSQAAFGIDLGGAKIVSQIDNGGPVIEIVVGPGVNLSSLTLSNFAINGSDGDGIKIVADGTDRGIGTLNIDNVSVEHVDGIGLDVIGNISHGLVANSWMNGNHQGGARFANSPNGGVASGLEWEGGGFRLNGVAGLILDNGMHDMTVKGAYFVDNHGPGIDATAGITLVQESGFENNAGAGAIVQGSANFTDVSFSTWGNQTTAVGGYLDHGKVTLTGVGNEYYGSGADPTVLANIQGSGTVAVSGTGTIVAGTNVTVTGGDPVIDGIPSDPVTTPVVSAGLANDTGGSATDQITSDAVLVGMAEAGAVVHFTVDGNAIAATATADEHGAWSYTPIGLTEGMHTIVASETNAAGTGSASLTFTLDTTAPEVTAALVDGAATTTLTGTGDADATVHFAIDGTNLAATATADASGAWSFTPTGLAQGTHTVIASETDAAGNTGSASLDFTLQPHPAVPEITGMVVDGGTVTLSANTAEPGDLVELYDGYTWLGWTRADASGHWSYSASVDPDATHSFGINEFTSAGQVLHGAGQAILGGAADATLTGTDGNDIINANGGNDTVVGGAGADTLTAGAGKATFAYGAASDSTPGAADTITDFKHGIDKIDFTAIAGIDATGGIPQFQGNITGSGNLTLEAHSVAFLEAGGSTHVLVNTTNAAETVTTSDTHAADMEITLVGVHLGLTSTDFHHS